MTGEILFLCHRIPFPPDRGDKIRSFNLLKVLARFGSVHVGAFADDERDMGFDEILGRLSASHCLIRRKRSRLRAGIQGLVEDQPMLVTYYDDSRLHQWVRKTLAERPIKAVVAYSVQMAQFVPVLPKGVPFIMDFVDFDSAKYASYGANQGGLMGWINRREGVKLFEFEKEVASRADKSLFVSAAEAELFRRSAHLPPDHIHGIDNGVNLSYFNPEADFSPLSAQERGDGPLLVFTGQMDYRPNIEAVNHFARTIFPLIRSVHHNARFAIVGRNPHGKVRALSSLPGVVVTGGVPDVRGWLAAANVVVAPLRIARGVQNKVLEAMAMGRPVVASAQAAEGIDARDGEDFLIAQDDAAAVNMVMRMIDDRASAAQLGIAARAHVVERYDWNTTLAPIAAMLGSDPASA